jgi:hypothetical protein
MSESKSQTTSWKERRRFHVMEPKDKGWKQREIATALDVSEGAVSRGLKKVDEQGKASLCARPHTGRETLATRFSWTWGRSIWISWCSVDVCPGQKSDGARV